MKKAGAWLGALAWMGVIFMMSAMPGDVSGAQSGRIAQLALRAMAFLFGEDAAAGVSPDVINLLVRKGAHMAEYAVLCLLLARALRLSGARRPLVAAAARFGFNFLFFGGTLHPTFAQNTALAIVDWVAGVAFAGKGQVDNGGSF